VSPSVYIIAGPNGAGKTTFAREFLPNLCRLQTGIPRRLSPNRGHQTFPYHHSRQRTLRHDADVSKAQSLYQRFHNLDMWDGDMG
jgi:ABC-type molybdenum transport system ATPase subunit/photorepair protein PhrA